MKLVKIANKVLDTIEEAAGEYPRGSEECEFLMAIAESVRAKVQDLMESRNNG